MGLCQPHTSPASRLEGDPSTTEGAEPGASRRKDNLSRLELGVFWAYSLPSPESLLNPAAQDLGLPWTFWGGHEEVPSLVPRSQGALRDGQCHGKCWLPSLARRAAGPVREDRLSFRESSGAALPAHTSEHGPQAWVWEKMSHPREELPPHHTKWDKDPAFYLPAETLIPPSLLEPMTHLNSILFL